MNDSTSNENNTLGDNDIDWEEFLASPSTSPNKPHKSKEVAAHSEACENNGMDTSIFSGDDEVNLLSPSFKVATSIFDETGKLIEFDPLDHFEKA